MIETITTYFQSLPPFVQIIVAHIAAVIFFAAFVYFIPIFDRKRKKIVWHFGRHIKQLFQ